MWWYFEKSLGPQQSARISCGGSLLYQFFLSHDLLAPEKDSSFMQGRKKSFLILFWHEIKIRHYSECEKIWKKSSSVSFLLRVSCWNKVSRICLRHTATVPVSQCTQLQQLLNKHSPGMTRGTDDSEALQNCCYSFWKSLTWRTWEDLLSYHKDVCSVLENIFVF